MAQRPPRDLSRSEDTLPATSFDRMLRREPAPEEGAWLEAAGGTRQPIKGIRSRGQGRR